MHRTEGALAPEVWILTTSADEFHVLIDLSHAFPRIVNKKNVNYFLAEILSHVVNWRCSMHTFHWLLTWQPYLALQVVHTCYCFLAAICCDEKTYVISIYKTTASKIIVCTKITHRCSPAIFSTVR